MLKISIEDTKADLKDQLGSVAQSINKTSASIQQELREDQARLQECIDLLTEAQSTTDAPRSDIKISHNVAGAGSVTSFGGDAITANTRMTISDNEAHTNARMVAGMHSTEVLTTMFQGTSMADALAILPLLQSSPANATNEVLQSMLAGRINPSSVSLSIDGPPQPQGQISTSRDAEQDPGNKVFGYVGSSKYSHRD